MRLTRLALTNFKSFQDTQVIDLAPVTLLFGPNSVGKSSVLMALAYVQQILKKGHCNPQKLDALGDKAIGGFRSLVNGSDLNKTIKIRLDYEVGNTPFDDYQNNFAEVSEFSQDIYLLLEDFGGSIETGAVELEIAWSYQKQDAYVKSYRTWVNQRYVGCITSNEDQRNTVINELNLLHPLLIPYNHEDWLFRYYGDHRPFDELEDDEPLTELEGLLISYNPFRSSHIDPANTVLAGECFNNKIPPILIACQSGAIPKLGSKIVTSLEYSDSDRGENYLTYLVIEQQLSQAFILPLDKLLEELEKSILIGPLRVMPDSDYISNPNPEQSDWVTGRAAWDLLSKNPNHNDVSKKLIHKTSHWFSSTDKLNTGYEVVNQSLADSLNLPQIEGQDLAFQLNKRHLLFKEKRSDLLLPVNQLGTGISQVLPIVVAANHDKVSLICVEQPELHIHPRLQVELADLFLENRDKHTFLIETHSEHLILRLLKRIRQTTDKELDEDKEPLTPDDISVTYLDDSSGEVVAKRIAIDEDGEFTQHWPKGFFAERREELM